MYLRYNSRSRNLWQKKFIKTVFESTKDKKKFFSKVILNNINLLNEKNKNLPDYLFKYYAPTSGNILDIKNKRLWLSHPKQFNDPFDCNIGYDKEKYEKQCLINYIDESNFIESNDNSFIITLNEKKRIIRSNTDEYTYWDSDKENYYDAKEKILDTKNKDFRIKVYQYLANKTKEADNKIKIIKDINIRVACFSKLDKYDDFHKQIVMWSHYADNHKGFCVEYDLSSLKKEISLTCNESDFYNNKKDEYFLENINLLVKAGLFPIVYSANRVNIPKTKLARIKLDKSGELIHDTNLDELVYKTFIVKSANWNYEKEWRVILDGNICEYFDNKIPFPFIKKIYIGCKASKELINTLIEIGNEIEVEVSVLRMDGKKFVLEDYGTWDYEREKSSKTYHNPFRQW